MVTKRKGDPTNTRERERVVREGSVLGNIAREFGNKNIGRMMDAEAIRKGDAQPETSAAKGGKRGSYDHKKGS